jgi:6-phosphogluconolactonase (cycloisomerase 2 family)
LELSVYKSTLYGNSIEHVETLNFGSTHFSSDLKHYTGTDFEIMPDGTHLYLLGSNRLLGFERDPATGKLIRLSVPGRGLLEFGAAGNFNSDLQVSADGRFMYVSGYTASGTAGIAIVARDSDAGSLSLVDIVDTGVEGPNSFRGNLFSAISPDQKNLYFFNKLYALMIVYNRNAITGELVLETFFQNGDTDSSGNVIDGLDEASSLAFSPDGHYLYITADEIYIQAVSPWTDLETNTSSLIVFRRNPENGVLTFIQEIRRECKDAAGKTMSSDFIQGGYYNATVSQNGAYLYAVTRKTRSWYESKFQNTIGIDVYKINPANGKVNFAQRVSKDIFGRGVSAIALANDGMDLLVVNEYLDSFGILNNVAP